MTQPQPQFTASDSTQDRAAAGRKAHIRLLTVEPVDPRITALARAWARVVSASSFVPEGRAHARAVLEEALRRLVGALGADDFDISMGHDVGRYLVANHISAPRSLGDSITLLTGRLLDELDIDSPAARSRLAALVGQLATGFTEALRDGALTAAEGINRAERTAWRDQQRRMYRRLQHALLHDQVTGLPNRAQFTGWLEEAIARAPQDGRIGICVLNIDRFKTINDSIGTDKADQLLLAVANRLRGQTHRYGHFLAHLGGDTFAIGIDGTTNSDDVAKAADRALRTLGDPIRLDGMQIPLTASAGIVERPAEDAQAVELVRAADISVGWAKTGHGGKFALFDAARNAVEVERHTLTAAMPAALAKGEFRLAYQPLVRLKDNAIVGVEALARWHHPELGVISPGQFIPSAEDTGLIVPLGLALLEQACAQAMDWCQSTGTAVLMSVNVAVAQIRTPGLIPAIASVLRRTGWPAERLQLEITESAFLGTDDDALETLHGLTRMGIRLSIDDFGTGYSNLAYLAELPVHNLKLAASFLRGLDQASQPGKSNRTILPALIALSHDLDLSVTAEGIETPEQAAHLRGLGCEYGQGFHLGKPMPPEHIAERLK